jgi:hypothetical protein
MAAVASAVATAAEGAGSSNRGLCSRRSGDSSFSRERAPAPDFLSPAREWSGIYHSLLPLVLINASASRCASTARSWRATTTCRRSPHDRSVELGRKLAARGYANIANLEGSLFAWANERKPVYSGTRLADRVHP